MHVLSERIWCAFRENVIGSAPDYTYEGGRLVRRIAVCGNIAHGPGKP